MFKERPCQENIFCKSLDKISKCRICKKCTHLSLQPKQELTFFKSSQRYAIVKSGLLASIFLTEEGKQKSIELFTPGSFIKTNDLFTNDGEEAFILETITPVSLCVFSDILFNELYAENPNFANAVLDATTKRLKSNLKHLLHIKTGNSVERVKFILDFLQESGVDDTLLTHEDIALITDLNRVTVTKALKNINRVRKMGG